MTFSEGDRVVLVRSLTLMTLGYDAEGVLVPLINSPDVLSIGTRGTVHTYLVDALAAYDSQDDKTPPLPHEGLVPVAYDIRGHRPTIWTPTDFLRKDTR